MIVPTALSIILSHLYRYNTRFHPYSFFYYNLENYLSRNSDSLRTFNNCHWGYNFEARILEKGHFIFIFCPLGVHMIFVVVPIFSFSMAICSKSSNEIESAKDNLISYPEPFIKS